MRVMLDTNVIISYAVFKSPTIRLVVEDTQANHELLISTFVIDELREVVARKWPDKLPEAERFLSESRLQTVKTPPVAPEGLFVIRDPNDYPVLNSAIAAGADVLVTGDKDFDGVGLDVPDIVTPAQYVERYAGTKS